MMSLILRLAGIAALISTAGVMGHRALDVYSQQAISPVLNVSDTFLRGALPKGRQPSLRAPRKDEFYAAILERPLFTPTRRAIVHDTVERQPADEPAPIPKPSKLIAPNLGLLGVMGNHDSNQALITNSGSDPIWVSKGTVIAGWTVAGIGADWLELTINEEKIKIEMYQP